MKIKRVECECLNCGNYFTVTTDEIQCDDMGKFVECVNCGATCDIEEN